MGTDNLFHKRKAKSDNDLKRRKAKRDPYSYVLIVCEGEKTEPLYLRELVRDLRLNTANVEVCGEECGSSPSSVLNFAKQKQKAAKKVGDPFDKVFCVFDKDTHESYDSTLGLMASLTEFDAITSVPCFEFWLLLHFAYTEKPFARSGDKSVCASVIADLNEFLPNYEKGHSSLYAKTKPMLEQAIMSSKSVLAASARNGTDNPSTKLHELIEYLQGIKKR